MTRDIAAVLAEALAGTVGMVDQMDRLPRNGGGVLPTDKAKVMYAARAALAQYRAAADGDAVAAENEACAAIADKWAAENRASCAKARKSLSQGSRDMAEMLDGAAIECNAIAQAIRARISPAAGDAS